MPFEKPIPLVNNVCSMTSSHNGGLYSNFLMRPSGWKQLQPFWLSSNGCFGAPNLTWSISAVGRVQPIQFARIVPHRA
ncbi:MAG TPA: hypothetical protein VL051_15825 [Burkholderiaceae bacterium]|nr:hypothetical protein [Burkholderiaceae bacterium]